ncbi:MAG: hypothetical protein N2Z60_04030 [Elusimicrobiales bacterium]|nr:hypothetical protein [Elusimicrobiales bacterium]
MSEMELKEKEKTKEEIIKDVVEDVSRTIPVIKNLLESVSISINSNNFEEAIKLLNPVITTLVFVSQIISYLESESDKNEIDSITINGEKISEIEKKWILKLEELRNSIRNNDMIKAGDIISYELPAEIERQVEIMKRLVAKK